MLHASKDKSSGTITPITPKTQTKLWCVNASEDRSVGTITPKSPKTRTQSMVCYMHQRIGRVVQ